MDIINFLASNIPLFSISLVMLFISFRNLKIRRLESIYFIIFTSIVLFLAIVVGVESYGMRTGNIVLTTIFSSLGYIFRPALLFVFILIANMQQKRKKWFYYLFIIPLAINFIVYLFPLFFDVPALAHLVFYYQPGENGTAEFVRGGFLNFASHTISILFLGLLVYFATARFHGKHRRDGMVFVLCAIIILVTVLAEMFTSRTDLLNIVSEICAMINYIFIISINTSRDPLTNLYDRRTFYEDITRYRNVVNGVVQIDMNELKYLNDNFGHGEGDTALAYLADVFERCINRNTMCTYRMSGDEFLILMFQGTVGQLDKTVNLIKEKLKDCKYSVAIGSYFMDNKKENITIEAAMKKAEELMYVDKARYYEESGHDRRKTK